MRVLILFAHPALEKSRVHRRLVPVLDGIAGVTFHDLYEAYPDFAIDVAAEQQRLLDHDLIIFQHPLYWYSTPALLKQWQDLVLEHGWAYGSTGTALRGKRLLSVITTGGSREAYARLGRHRHGIREFLLPIEQTALLCGMIYLPPYIIAGTHRLNDPDIERAAEAYARLIAALRDDRLDLEAAQGHDFLNDSFAALAESAVAP